MKRCVFLLVLAARQLVGAAPFDAVADRVLGQPSMTAQESGHSASRFNSPQAVAVDGRTGRVFVATGGHRVLSWPDAAAFSNGAAADVVLGQGDFGASELPVLDARRLNGPTDLAVDPAGNLYVASLADNRVLVFRPPFSNGMAAAMVIGQPDFASVGNGGGSDGMSTPVGIACDTAGNLWVADRNNSRVLRFPAPALTGRRSADLVIGQPDMNSVADAAGPSAGVVHFPFDVVVGKGGEVWVADSYNRVLRFPSPATGAVADLVLGQGDFVSGAVNRGGATGADGLDGAASLEVDGQGRLWCADQDNYRVVGYAPPFVTGMAATVVLGQVNFVTREVSAPPGAGLLSRPKGLAVDGEGDVYVADSDFDRVVVFDTPGALRRPVIAGLVPEVQTVNAGAGQLVVSGGNFVTSSVVQVNGVARPTEWIHGGRLVATLAAEDTGAAGTMMVTVRTPGVAGGEETSVAAELPVVAQISQDGNADRVLGQPGFGASGANAAGMGPVAVTAESGVGLASAASLREPGGVAVSWVTGQVFVADSGNHRVLVWSNASSFSNAQPADMVIGQEDFLRTAANGGRGLAGADVLNGPAGVALRAGGELIVSDSGNNRIMVYSPPFRSGMAGQALVLKGGGPNGPGVVTAAVDSGRFAVAYPMRNEVVVMDADFGGEKVSMVATLGVMVDEVYRLDGPGGVAFTPDGGLAVADTGHHRVLIYGAGALDAGTPGVVPERVLGQVDFAGTAANAGGRNARALNAPGAMVCDPVGNLWVADRGNGRVLRYADIGGVTANRPAAAQVLGAPNFTSSGAGSAAGAGTVGVVTGLALNFNANLFVADAGFHRVVRYGNPLAADWPFIEWRGTRFTAAERRDPAVSGAEADPDGDGRGNALEYLALTNPKMADGVGDLVAVTAAREGEGDVRLGVTIRLNRDAVDVPAWVEVSTDLGRWSVAAELRGGELAGTWAFLDNGMLEAAPGSPLLQPNRATHQLSGALEARRVFVRLSTKARDGGNGLIGNN
jgi:sugar lactone lactonase YvrE